MSGYGRLVVAHTRDGALVAGTTADFRENRAYFHVIEEDTSRPVRMAVEDLKAVFFVKTLIGDHAHHESKRYRESDENAVRVKVWVEFLDGEELAGWVEEASPENAGFFMYPADPASNLESVYVVRRSTLAIHQGDAAVSAAMEYETRAANPKASRIDPVNWDDMLGFAPSKRTKTPPSRKDYFLGDW